MTTTPLSLRRISISPFRLWVAMLLVMIAFGLVGILRTLILACR